MELKTLKLLTYAILTFQSLIFILFLLKTLGLP
jgi:hypothetical protein